MAKKSNKNNQPGGSEQEPPVGDTNTPPTGMKREAITIRKGGVMKTITRADLAEDPALLAWLKEKRPNLFI